MKLKRTNLRPTVHFLQLRTEISSSPKKIDRKDVKHDLTKDQPFLFVIQPL